MGNSDSSPNNASTDSKIDTRSNYQSSSQYQNASTNTYSNQTYTPNTNNNVNYYNPSNNIILSQNDNSRGKYSALSDSPQESNTPSFNNNATLSTDQNTGTNQSQRASQANDPYSFIGSLGSPSGLSKQYKNLIPILSSAGASYIVSYMLGSSQNQAFMSAGISGASYFAGEGVVDRTGSNNEIVIFLSSSTINAGALTYIGADIGSSLGTALISSAAGSAAKYIMARGPSGSLAGGPPAREGMDPY